MGIPQYLAMTDGEIAACARLPPRLARMGCHFSDDGLVGLPQALPLGALLVVDDRVPMAAQDPEHILDQLAEALEKLSCTGLLLDFQQEENAPQRELVRLLARELTVPWLRLRPMQQRAAVSFCPLWQQIKPSRRRFLPGPGKGSGWTPPRQPSGWSLQSRAARAPRCPEWQLPENSKIPGCAAAIPLSQRPMAFSSHYTGIAAA